jgi:hypothetical protein
LGGWVGHESGVSMGPMGPTRPMDPC